MQPPGQGADIAITDPVQDSYGLIVPKHIRINGQSVLTPTGYPMKVHEMHIGGTDAAYVTVTMYVRRLTIERATEQ